MVILPECLLWLIKMVNFCAIIIMAVKVILRRNVALICCVLLVNNIFEKADVELQCSRWSTYG